MRRTLIEPSRRASIRDRFGTPLAVNRVQYNAAVVYSDIAAIAAVGYEWKNGRKIKYYKRRQHIRELALLLAGILQLDADELEDRIHAEAALYGHTPYIVKKDISEKQYYQLKIAEMSWIGLLAQRAPKRFYPQGKVAGDVVGYMGAIDNENYQAILQERQALQSYVSRRDAGESPDLPLGFGSPLEVRERLKEIEELAYSMSDSVGKSGLESFFEELLRGYRGKKRLYVDSKGHHLSELPGGQPPIAGRAIEVTLSTELQEFCEQLLAQNEQVRKSRVFKPHRKKRDLLPVKEPWIKGGAIVALEPNTGEVLALASFPRIDPNDFIPSGDPAINAQKNAAISQWFETDRYIGEIWDGKRAYTREIFQEVFKEQSISLTWENFLHFLFNEESAVKKGLEKIESIQDAVIAQRAAQKLSSMGDLQYILGLLYQEEGHVVEISTLPAAEKEAIEANLNRYAETVEGAKAVLDTYLKELKHPYDKVLLIDLCRLVVDEKHFSADLLQVVGTQTLGEYRSINQSFIRLVETIEDITKETFRSTLFKKWREENEKTFLKEKRLEESRACRYARPYTYYLRAKERELFRSFWQEYKADIVVAFLTEKVAAGVPDEVIDTLLKRRDELSSTPNPQCDYIFLQQKIASMDLIVLQAYLQSMRRYSELNRDLLGKYRQLRSNQNQREHHLASSFYPTYGFSYGRSLAYRQATPQGSIYKLVTSYGALVQRYLKNPLKLNPLTMIDQPMRLNGKWIVGYTVEGAPIPQFYKGGALPRTLSRVGEIDLVRALEVSSNSYFALLASDHYQNPQMLAEAGSALSFGSKTGISLPGEINGSLPKDLEYNRTGLYNFAIGQHSLVVTPLQTATMFTAIANGGKVFQPKLVQSISGSCSSQRFGYVNSLSLVGIDFPLFVATWPRIDCKRVEKIESIVKRQLLMPREIQQMLLEGMERVSKRYQNRALRKLELLPDSANAICAVHSVKGQVVGKTATAESVENWGPDREIGTRTYNHIWYGSIIYDNKETFYDKNGEPELVVVVFLRYGSFGSDAVPLAYQVAAKWREIKNRQSSD